MNDMVTIEQDQSQLQVVVDDSDESPMRRGWACRSRASSPGTACIMCVCVCVFAAAVSAGDDVLVNDIMTYDRSPPGDTREIRSSVRSITVIEYKRHLLDGHARFPEGNPSPALLQIEPFCP